MKIPSKPQLRSEIEQQIADYLEGGGSVDHIDRGISGHDPSEGPIKPPATLFGEPRAQRTLVPEVVAQLEARRRPVKTPAKKKPGPARKVPIYDDFGDVVRWVWQDQISGPTD